MFLLFFSYLGFVEHSGLRAICVIRVVDGKGLLK